MRSLARLTIFFVLLFGIQPVIWPAPLAQDPKEPGTITGRVLVDGKPAQGVIVIATLSVSDPSKVLEQILKPPAPLKAATDSDGRYRLEAVPAGKYNIVPSALTLVSADPGPMGKDLIVADAATIENIDFSLSRGGVITGKVTDSEGQPVIGEEISLKPVDASKPGGSYSRSEGRMYFTDDRGIYRIFGLVPGHYIVSAGAAQDPISSLLARRPKRVQTYYPAVTDETRSKPVEVVAGAEASGVDIRLGIADKGFTVTGRVLAAETGAPIARAIVTYAPKTIEGNPDQKDRESFLGTPGGITTTNAKGEFRLDSLAPGSYKVEVESMGAVTGASDFYADPVNIEVQSANVDKLVIKVHLGASISGIVVLENADAADNLETLTPLLLMAVPDARTNSTSSGASKVAADGTFRIGGLKAGKANIRSLPYGARKFSVLRIERNGVEQPGGIDIQPNEQITGVRVILVPANCVIRGRVIIQGGTLSADSQISVWARPLNGDDSRRPFPVDGKGNFVIEDLAPGDYEVEVSAYSQSSEARRRVSAKQLVTVTSATPAEAILVLDLSAKGSGQ